MTHKLSEVLKELVQKKSSASRLIQRANSLQIWENILRGRIQFSCRPIRFEKGVLYLLVENPVVAQELSLQRVELIQALNERIGHDRITEIRFKIGYEGGKDN